MEKKTKAIIAGSIVGVLLLIVIYVNFFMGASPPADVNEAIKAADAAATQAEPAGDPAPLSPVEQKRPKQGQIARPGGN